MYRSATRMPTADLNTRAASLLRDPDTAPYPADVADPLAALLEALTAATKEQGAAVPGFDRTRALSLAVIASVNEGATV